jgi:hypothetical protein
MNDKDRQEVLTAMGQQWLGFILDKLLIERVQGLIQGVLAGWCVVVLVLAGVFKGHTIELPTYASIISAVLLGLIAIAQVWSVARLTNK